jgi:hypothetical protein
MLLLNYSIPDNIHLPSNIYGYTDNERYLLLLFGNSILQTIKTNVSLTNEVKENPIKELEVQKTENPKTTTKNSQLIEMIKTAEEAPSLKQICEKLKWQSHTARSAISRVRPAPTLRVSL